MASIQEIRQQFPQYGDLSDQQLADALYAKHYADMPRDQFDAKIGLAPTAPAAPLPNVDVPGIEPNFGTPAAPTGPGRALQVGVQGAGAGLAELAAMPFDLAAGGQNLLATGVNKLFGTNIPMATPASALVKRAGGAVMDAAGVPPVEYDEMSTPEKGAYNVNRFGAQAAALIPALTRHAATRTAEIAAGGERAKPKALDTLVKPYAGENAGRTVVGDAFASAGSGTAVTAADVAGYQDNPLVQTLAALAGGVGGMTIPQATERATRAAANVAGRPFGYHIDKSVPVDPTTNNPVTKSVSDRAALMVQDETVNPIDAAARIVANLAELRGLTPDAPIPSPAALSEDPGLSALERKINMANPGPATARNREFNSSVRDTIDRVAPDGADPSALVRRVATEADTRLDAAEGRIDRATAREGRIADIREGDTLNVTPFAGRGAPASQRLDQTIVDRGYIPARTKKNRQFDTAPGRNDQLPADEVFAAIDAVRANNNRLRPDAQLPGDLVARLDRLRPIMVDDPAAPYPGMAEINVGGPGTARGADLADTRKFIKTAYEQAQRAGNFDLADSLAALRASINRTLDAAPGYAEANANYGRFADTYRPSPNEPAARFTRDIDRDPQRGATPPSETAERFIQPDAPEKHAALRRMIDASADPETGRAAVRVYLMADLEASGVVRDGALNPARLDAWRRKWGDLETVAPGMGDEIAQLTDRAARGQRAAETAADRTQAATRNLRQTQSDIDRGAFGAVLNADPDKAVKAVMDRANSSGRGLTELIDVTAGDPAARNGLKAAVRDYLVEKATSGASEKLMPGDRRGPVSQAKLSGIFREHERELAQIFSPEEMNTLRAGHRALELANIERLRVSSGSDTAEKIQSLSDQFLGTSVGKGVEAALRLKYGMLKAGGMISTVRRMTSGVTGGPDPAEVVRLVERASADPDLMGLLLGRKLPVASPAWNAKMNRYFAAAEGARDSDVEK